MLHLVDYALLKPYLTVEEVVRGAERAETLGVAAYCVNPVYVPYVRAVSYTHLTLPTILRV